MPAPLFSIIVHAEGLTQSATGQNEVVD